MGEKIEIFISYSHRDESLRKELENHLRILERQGVALVWHDRRIGAGQDWAGSIHTHLNTCHIILLLVSADFMASDYCNDVEVQRAMERYENGEAYVIPVLLRPTIWEFAPFGKLKALPPSGKPVTRSRRYSKDRALSEVAEGIQMVIAEILARRSTSVAQKECDGNSLYEALLTLDYLEQVKTFRRFRERSQTGAFLIHGQIEYGQRWLLNRLVRQVPGSGSGKPPFRFDFQRKVGARSLDALWRRLGKWANPTKPSMLPAEIVEQVHRIWQYQTVLLILDDLDTVDEQCISDFLHRFWGPLMDQAQRVPCRSQNHYLLMFLVDNTGCTDGWSLPLAERLDSAWRPHIPVKLEKISRITDEVLFHWLNHEVDRLPTGLHVPGILAGSGGIPQIVLENICSACGYDWYEGENLWIKY
jgi:inactive STAND/TIR domain